MGVSKPRDINNDNSRLSGRELGYSQVSASIPQRIVLVLGSAPDAVQCQGWPKSSVSDIVAINNAWRLRDGRTSHVKNVEFYWQMVALKCDPNRRSYASIGFEERRLK